MRVEVNKQGKIDVFTDKKDVCFDCANNTECPLIEALRAEIVIIRYENVDILKCGLLKKARRKVNGKN